MVLWVFDGDMVGKWTNEPCNGVDEVVNPFWVITDTQRDLVNTPWTHHVLHLFLVEWDTLFMGDLVHFGTVWLY